MRPLFKPNGEPAIDPNGKWVIRAGIQIYLYYCCSKKHSYVDPNIAAVCCSWIKENSNAS